MTECPYPSGITSFAASSLPRPVRTIPLIENGAEALMHENKTLGLAMDDQDISYYWDLFANQLKRNPTGSYPLPSHVIDCACFESNLICL